jgi:hypothetical protein
LEARYFDLLQAILRVAKIGQSGRDKLAHWIWGYSPQIPDAFLLANPRDTVSGITNETVYVYKQRDFDDIIKLNDRLCGYGLQFLFILRKHVANEDDALYHELCAEPDLQDKLSRQA